MLQKEDCRYSAKTTNAPCISLQLPQKLLWSPNQSKWYPSTMREFRKTVSRSVRLPVMTCLDALPSPWLMKAICDIWMHTSRRIKEREREKTKPRSYFKLMMLLCCWRLKPKYLSHNSYLVFGWQRNRSAGGRRPRLSGPQRVENSKTAGKHFIRSFSAFK